MNSTRCRRLLVTCALLFLCFFPSLLLVHAQTESQISAHARLTEAIDESSLVTLHGNTHPLAQPKFDTGPAPVSMPAKRLLLVLRRSAEQEAALKTYLESLQNPDSPNYLKWITPDEFGSRFGVSDADLATVETWLQGHGFTINKIGRARMIIEVSGTVGQIQSAFHTPIHGYSVDGEQHWANTSSYQWT